MTVRQKALGLKRGEKCTSVTDGGKKWEGKIQISLIGYSCRKYLLLFPCQLFHEGPIIRMDVNFLIVLLLVFAWTTLF